MDLTQERVQRAVARVHLRYLLQGVQEGQNALICRVPASQLLRDLVQGVRRSRRHS